MNASLSQPMDARTLRRAFGRFATGVTIVTTCPDGGKPEGMTANSFTSLSLDPPLLLWCPQRNAVSFPAFEASGHFAVHVLRSSQQELAMHFARPSSDKFAGHDWEPGLGGSPLLPGCLARFECRTEQLLPGGDHAIMVGRILQIVTDEGEPLLYNCGDWCVPVSMPERVTRSTGMASPA